LYAIIFSLLKNYFSRSGNVNLKKIQKRMPVWPARPAIHEDSSDSVHFSYVGGYLIGFYSEQCQKGGRPLWPLIQQLGRRTRGQPTCGHCSPRHWVNFQCPLWVKIFHFQ
jgi:hypothetical protein